MAIAVLPACGPHYKRRSLSYLQQAPTNYIETKDNVTLEIKKLDKAHTKPLFDGQGRYLPAMGLQPLYFKIVNNSDKTFLFNSHDISLATVSSEIIKEALSKNYLPIAGTFGKCMIPVAGSLFLLKVFSAASHPILFIFAIPTVIFCATLLIFGTPICLGYACYSSYQTKNQVNEYNENLDEDIREKSTPADLKIPADTQHEFIFFADAAQFKNNFAVTFAEKITQKTLTFNVTL